MKPRVIGNFMKSLPTSPKTHSLTPYKSLPFSFILLSRGNHSNQSSYVDPGPGAKGIKIFLHPSPSCQEFIPRHYSVIQIR